MYGLWPIWLYVYGDHGVRGSGGRVLGSPARAFFWQKRDLVLTSEPRTACDKSRRAVEVRTRTRGN